MLSWNEVEKRPDVAINGFEKAGILDIIKIIEDLVITHNECNHYLKLAKILILINCNDRINFNE